MQQLTCVCYRIAPEGKSSIPNFSLQGRPNIPELLSNKLIMTQPAPGNQRGAVWTDQKMHHTNWIADVEFRANGPERGAGNLNIWLARDGPRTVGTESLYTVGKFEGLVLVIDQYGGSGGMVRGFLNDGTTDYKSHHNVDNLAFGHCSFAYRNLGRPSQIKLRHNEHKFIVEVDSRVCFESDKITIPNGYNLGITAASADTPDSFEVFKLVVLHEDGGKPTQQNQNHNQQANSVPQQQQQQQQQNKAAQDPPRQNYGRQVDDPYDTAIPDQDANQITSQAAQFADLHNRIQSVNHHLTSIFRSLGQNAGIGEQRHQETSVMIGELKGLLMSKMDRLEAIDRRLNDMEKEVRAVRNELSARLRESENSIKYHVTDKHETLADHVVQHAAPGHTKLILVIIGSQVFLVGGYIYYKRKKSMPKKYL